VLGVKKASNNVQKRHSSLSEQWKRIDIMHHSRASQSKLDTMQVPSADLSTRLIWYSGVSRDLFPNKSIQRGTCLSPASYEHAARKS
jgi:hypothetical protein